MTALVGENGAGKSTLVKVLTGIYQPDAGDITIDGKSVRFPTPQSAEAAGVTAIHQETVLFDELSVAENIFLGHAPKGRFGQIDRHAMTSKAKDILSGIGAAIDPGVTLKDPRDCEQAPCGDCPRAFHRRARCRHGRTNRGSSAKKKLRNFTNWSKA